MIGLDAIMKNRKAVKYEKNETTLAEDRAERLNTERNKGRSEESNAGTASQADTKDKMSGFENTTGTEPTQYFTFEEFDHVYPDGTRRAASVKIGPSNENQDVYKKGENIYYNLKGNPISQKDFFNLFKFK